MTKIIGRIAQFKVNPGTYNPYKPGFGHYYKIHIFDCSENLWAYGYSRTKLEKDKAGYGALTIPAWRERFDKFNNTWIVAPKVGDVLFYKNLLRTSVITHESVHAATSFLRIKKKLKLNEQIDNDEELFAYCVGSIAKQIVDKLYKLKIL